MQKYVPEYNFFQHQNRLRPRIILSRIGAPTLAILGLFLIMIGNYCERSSMDKPRNNACKNGGKNEFLFS